MPLLATYTYAGAASLAGEAASCFAHGLPTTPDWAIVTPIGPAGTAAALSMPIELATRATNAVIWVNNGASVNAEMVCQFAHSLIR